MFRGIMPEIVNNSPLMDKPYDFEDSDKETMVKIDHVSMIFNMANEQLNSLKEYMIAFAKHELRFKEFRALDDISLEIKKGDVFGILGTNGSGKSTLLKIIAGVLDPSKGTCKANGNIAPLIELGAGFDMELTARENIYLNGALLGYSKSFIQQNFDEIVEFAEVGKFLDMPLKNYSSGMVARIAFAIATVIVPEILIVDEVLSVGDFMFQKKCEERIMSLIKEHNVTVLIVSHSNDQIERLCNKAAWIEKGKLRMLGPASDVCKTYRVLGGHIGSGESEQKVLSMLTSDISFPGDSAIDLTAESKYGIASKLSSQCFTSKTEDVVIVSGENDFDFALANSLAGSLNAPILVTQNEHVPDVTFQELARLNPKNVILITSDEKIGTNIGPQIKTLFSQDINIDIIASDNYPELSLNVFEYGKKKDLWNKRIAIVAYKECTGDIISFSPFAYSMGVPILLKDGTDPVPQAHYELLKKHNYPEIIVLGGSDQFPNEYLLPLEETGIKYTQICGKDAYDANGIINNWIEQNEPNAGSIENLLVTSFWHPSDAYAAGMYAAHNNALILLEDPDNLDSVAHSINFIEQQNGRICKFTFVGDKIRFSDLDKALLAKTAAKTKNEMNLGADND